MNRQRHRQQQKPLLGCSRPGALQALPQRGLQAARAPGVGGSGGRGQSGAGRQGWDANTGVPRRGTKCMVPSGSERQGAPHPAHTCTGGCRLHLQQQLRKTPAAAPRCRKERHGRGPAGRGVGCSEEKGFKSRHQKARTGLPLAHWADQQGRGRTGEVAALERGSLGSSEAVCGAGAQWTVQECSR